MCESHVNVSFPFFFKQFFEHNVYYLELQNLMHEKL